MMHCHLEQRTAMLNSTTICKGVYIVHEHDIVKMASWWAYRTDYHECYSSICTTIALTVR